MHLVRQMTIGFLLLATIFGGVWSLRNSSDSVYSISKSSPSGTGNVVRDQSAGDETSAAGGGIREDAPSSGDSPSPTPTPTASAPVSPSASPSAAPKPPAKPVVKKPVPRVPAKPKPRPKPAKPATGDQPTKDRVVTLVNGERSKAGCGAVHTDTRLAAAAQGHSDDMAARGYFDHVTPEGRTLADRADAAGYPYG